MGLEATSLDIICSIEQGLWNSTYQNDSILLVGLGAQSQKEETMKKMKSLDDETVVKDDDGRRKTRDVVDYIGEKWDLEKKWKRTIIFVEKLSMNEKADGVCGILVDRFLAHFRLPYTAQKKYVFRQKEQFGLIWYIVYYSLFLLPVWSFGKIFVTRVFDYFFVHFQSSPNTFPMENSTRWLFSPWWTQPMPSTIWQR